MCLCIVLNGYILVELPVELGIKKDLGSLRNPDGTFIKGIMPTGAGRPPGIQNMPNLGGPLTNEILANLENLSKAQLINIIKRVGGAIWGVGLMTDDEAYEAVRLKLLHTGLTSDSANTSLNVIKEWIDRTKGKAVQRIDQRIETVAKVEPSEMTNDQLLAMLAKASVAGALPAGVKVEGGKVITDAEYSTL
jgi:hypothetical protein